MNSNRWIVFASCCVVFIYLFAFNSLPWFVFWSPDEGAKFIQFHTTCGIKAYLPYPGQSLDPEYNFYPDKPHYPQREADNMIKCHWPTLFPLVSRYFYDTFGIIGLYVIPLISGLLITMLAGRLTYLLLPAATSTAILAVGLSTPIFFYSLLFWEHTVVVLLGLTGLWLVIELYQTRYCQLATILSIFLLILATLMRVEMIVYMLALLSSLALTVLLQNRHKIGTEWKTIAVISIGILFLFGILVTTLPDRYSQIIETALVKVTDSQQWFNLPQEIRNLWINTSTEFSPAVDTSLTWLGLLGLVLAAIGAIRYPRQRWLIVISIITITGVSLYVLFLPQPYRNIHAIFLMSPFLVLAFLIVPYARALCYFETTVLALTIILYLFIGTAAVIARGGAGAAEFEWGPRYMLMFFPLAGIGAAVGAHYFYQQLTYRSHKIIFVGLAILTLFIGLEYQIRGIQEVQRTKQTIVAYAEIVEEAGTPVVTDVWWLPAVLAPRFVDQEIYTLPQQEDLHQWLNHTNGQVDSFMLVSQNPLNADFVQAAPHPIRITEEQIANNMFFIKFHTLR